MRSMLTNPDALQAIMQIQQGMQRLQTVMPNSDLMSGLGFPLPPSSSQPSSTTTNRPPTGNIPTTAPSNTQSANYFAQMMNMMANNTIVSHFILFLSSNYLLKFLK